MGHNYWTLKRIRSPPRRQASVMILSHFVKTRRAFFLTEDSSTIVWDRQRRRSVGCEKVNCSIKRFQRQGPHSAGDRKDHRFIRADMEGMTLRQHQVNEYTVNSAIILGFLT